MNQQQQSMIFSQNANSMNLPHQSQLSYGMWTQQQQFAKHNSNAINSASNLGPRSKLKGKKFNKMPHGKRRMDVQKSLREVGGNLFVNNFNSPTLNELQYQNKPKARKFFPKKFNRNKSNSAPFAPRNTTSFIIRAKKSGGIAPLVSPYPVTPAVLDTPTFSPSREVLVEMAKEEWGVDGYGSMNGLIRLRSPTGDHECGLDHDLNRFEMVYNPNRDVGIVEYNNVLGNRVDDQDSHIAQLEEENSILKERLFLLESEAGDLRRRLLCLECSEENVFSECDDGQIVEGFETVS